MERTQHYILNYLDEPTKILFFTPFEIIAMGLCFFGGIFIDHFVAGVALAALSVFVIRKVRSHFKITSAHQLMYWVFPHSETFLRCKIPSHIREFHP